MRIKKKDQQITQNRTLFLTIVGFLVALQGCTGIELTEVSNAISPDGHWKAIIVKSTTAADNATTSTVHEVRIGESTARVEDTDVVLEIDSEAGLAIEWLNAERLVISFRDGRVMYYRNIWECFGLRPGDDYCSIDVVLIWKFGEEESP